MANRLADSPSDHLLQYAHQPVDWWPWGSEALAHAAELDRPVLLSIGYASCHWCHVMSHESFENPETAEFINTHFVPVKVDREQQPVLDQVFMTATQLMNEGAGGWPLTAFLTPDGRPFFTGTYFPPEPQPGRPSFRQVLQALAETWESDRQTLVAGADVVAGHLAALSAAPLADTAPEVHAAIDTIGADFDLIHAGFGTAPKFPSATVLDALLVRGDAQSLELAQRSLEAMARGGIHDQVGGGFHRYATDPGWVIPHFEKMLDDNALLLGTYIRGWRRTADHDEGLRALLERTAYGIAGFLERELRDENGAFMAGLDADSCDIRGAVFEGIHYLWTPELLFDALGDEDGDWATQVFHVTAGGTFGEGLSTLQLRGRPDLDRLAEVSARLLTERGHRFRPATDRLVVTAWNALAISSLVTGALIWNEPHWLDLALDTARYLAEAHLAGGELRHSSLAGQVNPQAATAEDHGTLADAFTVLAGATGDAAWLRRAETLCDGALELFSAEDGGFFDAEAGELFVRSRSLTDNVTPSGTSALVRALRRVGLMAERPGLLARADAAAATTWATVAENPRFAGSALEDLMVADEARRGLRPAMVVVSSGDPFDELARAAWRLAPAGSVILTAPAGTGGFGSWLEGREKRAVYVCRGDRCFDPVTDYTELKTPLWHRV
ncbi:thioredoxin domain-containing protein [Arachnia rubra]|uniref:Thioredoxin domain-containing protein n=1 Tax=Arachnia rubra TaxID=1547448 RepID=A0ABX7Y6Y6_9ACTN|nr:thioredoxin domain-containing protein [Arachnia rubra]QUC08751.1 thioredoxin domain-containing protein [Arachnia rubra]